MAPAMPHVEGVEHRYARVNGFRMHYAEAGSGDPLILLHGWPQHWWAWRNQIPALAEHYRVIVPDIRGYGWSEAPPSGYEKAQFARDVVGLMDELGIEKAHYAGHDWGAFTGYILAMDHPERVTRVAALSVPPPWRSGPPPPKLVVTMLSYQTLVSTPIIGPRAMRNGLATQIFRAGRSIGEFSDEELEIYEAPWREPGHDNAGTQTYRTFLTREVPAQLRGAFADKRLHVPVLVAIGAREILRKGLQPEAYEKRGDVRTEFIDSNHFVMEERPEEVTRLLLDFFAETG